MLDGARTGVLHSSTALADLVGVVVALGASSFLMFLQKRSFGVKI